MEELHAGEAGKVLIVDVGWDWAGYGHTMKLHITKDNGTPLVMSASAHAVPTLCTVTTNANTFPVKGEYRVQGVSYIGSDPMIRSDVVSLFVLGNN